MQIGRRIIWTDEYEINSGNVIRVIQDAIPAFTANAVECENLLQIEAGNFFPSREKLIRPEIDVKTTDPIAHEITVFKEGYHWSNPITFVQRGSKDSGKTNENEAITLLNECYAAENVGKKQNQLGHYVEICGIGYTLIDIKKDWEEGDSYFQYEVLDPRFAFVVRSTRYLDHRILLAVTFVEDVNHNKHYTAFTADTRYEIEQSKIINGKEDTKEEYYWAFARRSGEKNPLGKIPIIEWERAADRMGVFEREIPEIDRLNLIISDIGNDIDAECQMIWWTNDVDFPEKVDADGKPTGEAETPKANEWVQTYTSRDGHAPSIKPLVSNYDYQGLLNNYMSTRALILQRTYTPLRNDDSGGSTGVAMSDATGWSAAEQVAASQQTFMESSKMNEVKVALAAIKKSHDVEPGSPLLDLKYMDVKPNITRQKTYEMSVKTTAFANLISHGVYGLHALKAINFFDDVAQVWEDSKSLIEDYQKSTFGEKEEVQKTSDLPDNQITNSPLIDGMSKENPKPETSEEKIEIKKEVKDEKG